MNILLEFWEFSKSIYGHNKAYKDATTYLSSYSENKHVNAILKNGEYIKINKIEDGLYYGEDMNGIETEGDFIDIEKFMYKK